MNNNNPIPNYYQQPNTPDTPMPSTLSISKRSNTITIVIVVLICIAVALFIVFLNLNKDEKGEEDNDTRIPVQISTPVPVSEPVPISDPITDMCSSDITFIPPDTIASQGNSTTSLNCHENCLLNPDECDPECVNLQRECSWKVVEDEDGNQTVEKPYIVMTACNQDLCNALGSGEDGCDVTQCDGDWENKKCFQYSVQTRYTKDDVEYPGLYKAWCSSGRFYDNFSNPFNNCPREYENDDNYDVCEVDSDCWATGTDIEKFFKKNQICINNRCSDDDRDRCETAIHKYLGYNTPNDFCETDETIDCENQDLVCQTMYNNTRCYTPNDKRVLGQWCQEETDCNTELGLTCNTDTKRCEAEDELYVNDLYTEIYKIKCLHDKDCTKRYFNSVNKDELQCVDYKCYDPIKDEYIENNDKIDE